MKPETSLYLDVLRFGSALLVFLGHVGQGSISGGVLWQLTRFGAVGVIVFFVLSGYVISYVTTFKESDIRSYFVARAGRLYSVALPALLLTAVVDLAKRQFFPDAHVWGPDILADFGWRLVVSGLFLNEAWGAHVHPGSDIPYWSMSYEVAYYALFGAAIFTAGRRRWVAVGAIMLLVGPRILALAPSWLFGVAAHRMSGRKFIPGHLHWPMFVTTTVFLASFLIAVGHFNMFLPDRNLSDYGAVKLLLANLLALLIAAHLVSFEFVSHWFGWIKIGKRLIQGAAATTFGLYLYHMPILTLVAAWLGPPTGSVRIAALIAGLSLVLSVGLAWISESRKRAWQRIFAFAYDRIRPAAA